MSCDSSFTVKTKDKEVLKKVELYVREALKLNEYLSMSIEVVEDTLMFDNGECDGLRFFDKEILPLLGTAEVEVSIRTPFYYEPDETYFTLYKNGVDVSHWKVIDKDYYI